MRTAAIVLVTVITTAAATSAFWLVYWKTEPVAAPARTVIAIGGAPRKAAPAPQQPIPHQPEAVSAAPQPGAAAARLGEVPADLLARQLAVPVAGIGKDALIPAFFDARGERGHEAIDIIAARGAPVIAVEDGVIAKLFNSVRGGLTVYQFDPSGTYAYYYAHLDRYADGLKEGDSVTRGQVIGYVGSTGNANEANPHLHFAIFLLGPEKSWWKGAPLDPYPALTAR